MSPLDSHSEAYLNPYPVVIFHVWSLLELLGNEHCVGIIKRQDSSGVNVVFSFSNHL